ncbi:copper resistance protein NlpE [Aquiflexum gelatinilyticum]|uniref:copper resistance protein NlpE n=1 Tax=Aquiflexum gelatinilyticum TaxID=2961943 RepID=UPI002166C7E7|nr:copper resistance protein NlpE [Aquiflexum gelatinilyticum]MCS4436280.1 copper resistance protein NlpE [Aquiflexum gelatinilyticum]
MIFKHVNALFFLLSLLTICFSGCKNNAKQDDLIVDDAMFETEESVANDGHNSSNSLDFFGTYKGIIPCADCEGIEIVVELGTGNSYSKKSTYLGKENQNVIESSGTFTWNEAGNTITLTGEAIPNQYFVGENILFHLDVEGNRITGDLAEKYQLIKQ